MFDFLIKFGYFSEKNKVACDVLSICFSNLEIKENTENSNSSILERCLTFPNDDVKFLGLNELYRSISKSKSEKNDLNMLLSAIKCLSVNETKVGTAAAKLVGILLINFPEFLDNSIVIEHLEELMNGNDITKCRIYEMAAELVASSDQISSKLEFILDRTVKELDNKDILLQMNILKILEILTLTNHGFQYLEKRNIIVKLIGRIEKMELSPLDKIMVPGLMKFFGKLAMNYPEKIYNGYPIVIETLLDSISSGDLNILPAAFDTLGYLAQKNDGKICLSTIFDSKINQTLTDVGEFFRNLPTEVKLRGLTCFKLLFENSSEEENNQISTITETWHYALTNSHQLNFIMDFCKNSFLDIKVCGLGVAKSLSTYQWAQKALQNTAGFSEYLLDRIEHDPQILREKYEIIVNLSKSTVFDEQTLHYLNNYIKDGVFYIPRRVEVAIEGE